MGHASCSYWYPQWLCLSCDGWTITLTTSGAVQYKFIVDGDWKYAPDQPAMYDEMNNVNNVLEVQEYVPENLESLSSFEPPPSPPERCAASWPSSSLVFTARS